MVLLVWLRLVRLRATRQPPKPGLYVSTKNVNDMRFIVEDEESKGFFLVSMIDETSAGDMSAASDELDPDQWFALVEQYGLVHKDV